jgi:hypothetical protein
MSELAGATAATTAQLHAGTGHAWRSCTRRVGGSEALVHLSVAVDELDPVDQARAAALCPA